MPQLLIELLSEEIPARMQAQAAKDLERMARERLAVIAEKGMANPWVHSNPRKISEAGQLLTLLESAWA